MKPAAASSFLEIDRARAMHLLLSLRLIDSRFGVISVDGMMTVPLVRVPEDIGGNGFLLPADPSAFEGRYAGRPFELIRFSADIPPQLKGMLPRKWELLGKSALIKLDPTLLDYVNEIGRAYAKVLKVENVYMVEGRIGGRYRKPAVRLIYGTGGETVHHENGVDYVIDAGNVMFSSANHDERIRMSTIDCTGEVVVDMFAGIGHLSMPLAVHSFPAKVIAAEADPTTFSYLLRTVEANGVGQNYSPVNIDNMLLDVEECDRIVMGYLDGTRNWLGKALSMSRRGTIIHFHEEVRRGFAEDWRELVMRKYCAGRVRAVAMRRVKGYSALSDHMALDLEVTS
jgi:tRNA wybutosine-synthesizing protein 2